MDSSLVYMGNNKIATSGNKGIEILDISTNPIAPIYTNTTLVDIVGILCALPHAHAAQIATEQLAVGTISGEVYILDERAQIVHTFFIDDLGDSEDIMCLLWIEGSSSSEVWVGDSFGHIYILDIDTKEQYKLQQNIHPEGIRILEKGRGALNGSVISAGEMGFWVFGLQRMIMRTMRSSYSNSLFLGNIL